MIELTEEQQRALSEEDPPRVLDPVTRATYFLVRSDLYERLRGVFDDLPDASVLINELMAEDDAHDPYLEMYQNSGGQQT